jgi:hypothetical protein
VNHRRLYEYRFRDVDQRRRDEVWGALAPMLHDALGRPERVLDPAAGRCEFINAVPATSAGRLTLSDMTRASLVRDYV